MNFKEVSDELSVLRKFHTCNGKDKTVFYRGLDNVDGELRVKTFLNSEFDVFELKNISLLSLSRNDGLLIHYDTFDGRKLYPYRFMNIESVNVSLR